MNNITEMCDHIYVIKRNGNREPVSFDKILHRIEKLSEGLEHINPDLVSQKVCSQIHDGIKTSELDEFAAETCAMMQARHHPNYGKLAARIVIDNHQKLSAQNLLEAVETLHNGSISVISNEYYEVVKNNAETYEKMIDYSRDFNFDYFGFKTLLSGYLLKQNDEVIERPQHLWMRVAIQLHGNDFQHVKETYDALSFGYFTHATPTLFNSGSNHPQLSSCFIAGTKVHTMKGVKNIEDVDIDDEVITHTGNIKKVKQLHTNLLGDRKLFDIKIAGTPNITVTGNHRLWSLSSEQEEWGKSPNWNRVDYLRAGDWIAIPNKKVQNEDFVIDLKDYLNDITGDGDNIQYAYDYESDKVYPKFIYKTHHDSGSRNHVKKVDPINRYWKFTPEVMELLGIWYGDGCIVHTKNSIGNMKPRSINIVSYHNNQQLIEFVSNKFKELLGVSHITISTDKYGMTSININNTIIANLFKKIFKSGFDGKRIPDFFNKFSYEHIQYFLAGLTSSDGCVTKKSSVCVQLTNQPLVNDIYHLARSVGIPITVTFMHSENKKATGRMSIPFNIVSGLVKKVYNDDRLLEYKKPWNNIKIINGTTFMRLNSKTISNITPNYVYTLGVEDDHSYSVGGIIAENCFLVQLEDDSIEGIYNTLGECAQISKWAGGIGLSIHNIRAKNSLIRGTNGKSTGLVPMLKVFNDTAKYVNQGGKRNGAFAIYLEPWHADIEDFLRLKMNTGNEDERARDLFYGLWIPDLFMKYVEEDKEWSLFNPDECPGLADVWGSKFEDLYHQYESEGKARNTIPAKKLWQLILDSQIQTGTPYLCYKDAANSKSNQQNLGTIKSSNLCCEVIEYTSKDETAVCNLGSIALSRFVKDGKFDFELLRKYTKILARNLDIVIDKNYYPTEKCRRSNMKNRPIGIGVQGLADVFALMRLSWTSEEASRLNKEIFENIYFAALETSQERAYELSAYETFDGSPASKGQLQYHLWNTQPTETPYLDWNDLQAKVVGGIRNSLLVAPMPTASTSQILGNNECIEPFTSNLYSRRVLAGDFVVINKYLVEDLLARNLWTSDVRTQIIANNGSIQTIQEIPAEIRELYRTSWEIPMKTLINMARDRAPFICQSQSLNLFVAEPTYSKISSMHFYAWKCGLKTGCYYLRTKAAAKAQQFTVEPPTGAPCVSCSS